ncbi:30S ribosomal protein S9 [Candidatus Mycoplasma haematohominis]|uniref:30S ribosomal protein S9 n=1 Tax=Candidatus Mycoplasma haematohominis TaxID=1494318 RepID=A0A478FPS9_9MOLU|nr:30S ribosomal protein S9 [Candidatus Mycoplasma haemohominis]GCE63431.1 30S ribosomal protein S9 [Candidatus Mycoplasma haemohominis]
MSAERKYFGFGNRKESVAKVHLMAGTGKITLWTGNVANRKERDVKEYFCNDFLIDGFLYPLKLVGKKDSLDINLFVKGGGKCAQADAVKLGIARALLEIDPSFKPILRTYNLLTQDKRFKERKKVGKMGARRSPQFTKR